MPWFLYIVECADSSYYTGITTNIDRRIEEHNAGKGAKYTQGRAPVQLAYTETFEDRSSASKREYEVKSFSKVQKKNLIELVNKRAMG